MRCHAFVLTAFALLLRAGAAFPEDLVGILESAARRDPAYVAEEDGLRSRAAALRAREAGEGPSLGFYSSASTEYAILAGRLSLPVSASASLALGQLGARQEAARVREAEMAAIRQAEATALNEAMYRVVSSCLRASEAALVLDREREKAAQTEGAVVRPRGVDEDNARAALRAATAAIDLETAERAWARESAALAAALNGPPPTLGELGAFLDSLQPSDSRSGPAQRSAALAAELAAAQTELTAARATGLSLSLSLGAATDALDLRAASVSLGAALGVSPGFRAARAGIEAALAASAAAGRKAEAEAAAQELRITRLGLDIESKSRSLTFAENALSAARALADLAKRKLALGAIAIPEYASSLDLVAARQSTRDSIAMDLLELKLERARQAGLLAPPAKEGP